MGPALAQSAERGFSQDSAYEGTRPRGTGESTKYVEPEAPHNGRKNIFKADLNNLVVLKRSNKPIHALNLPIIANIN